MFIYAFRQSDMCYSGTVEVPDGTTAIPQYHTFEPPPEQEGFHAVMRNGWILVEGPTPPEPPPFAPYVPTEEEILAAKRALMVVSPLQAKAALLQAGMLDTVEAYVLGQDTDRLVKLAYNNAIEWRRLSPMIEQMGSALGISPEQMDEVFVLAESISV